MNIIKIMSINLRFGLADDKENSWERRKTIFTELFTKHPCDFICTQEANDFQTEYLSGILPEFGYIGLRKPAPDFWQNNIIFYNKSWSLIDSSHFFLSKTPLKESKFKESRWPRQCTTGLFEKNSQSLMLVDTHFDFKEEVQKKSAQLMMKILNAKKNIPTVLCGDFNAKPESAAHNIFTDKNNFQPFADIFSRSYAASTHHGFTGIPDKKIGRIDWILYRNNLLPVDTKIITDSFNKKYPSDHFPVFAAFSIKKKI